jgi:hypothetical protein
VVDSLDPEDLLSNHIDQHTRDNWLKVKTALENAGKTDSPFYSRAAAIVNGGADPGPNLPPLGGSSDISHT